MKSSVEQIDLDRSSWLVQRLDAPRSRTNPYAFGGGYKNGGLPDAAMSLLSEIFSFHYMGAAEFEFGALPKALLGLEEDSERLIGFSISIPLRKVAPPWKAKKDLAPEGDATVWVICRVEHQDEVERRIREFAAGKGRTKERVGLDSALRPFDEWDTETIGWLEISNGFFFFVSEEAWKSTCELFGVDVSG